MNQTLDDLMERLRHHTRLGHAARDAAFLRQVALAVTSGGTSLAKAAGASASPLANLVSLYRFLDNADIPVSAMRQARARFVLERIPRGSPVLVVHDLTQLNYSRHPSKTDRRLIGDHREEGYEYTACALIDPASGAFLGLVHDTLLTAHGPDDQETIDYGLDPLFADFSEEEKQRLRANHRHQMVAHIHGLSPLLAHHQPIDVADREFDDIFILDRCLQNRRHFVIRSSALRNVQVPQADWIPPRARTRKQAGHPLEKGWLVVHLKRLVEAIPLRPYKALPLDADNRVVDASAAVRTAHLGIGTCRVRLYRPAKRNKRYFLPPRIVEVNLVVIRELTPPAHTAPLLWVLFTSLPVDTTDQLFYIGHLYELRWKIEEFFKLLKSGYRIEAVRLDSAPKIAKLLVLLSLAAMTLLTLKTQLGLPAGGRLSDADYRRVKSALSQLDNPQIPLNLRLFAFIARTGGWLARRNDPIGPTLLMRGALQFFATLDALTRYGPLLNEVLQSSPCSRRQKRV